MCVMKDGGFFYKHKNNNFWWDGMVLTYMKDGSICSYKSPLGWITDNLIEVKE